ncbi:chitin binding peritrophin-A domain-containing protein [Nocardia sp. NPDC057030]|uniref:chitin binding peritrophin-A domain-containing protein n=1 Tax=unclassified Nocardia TaxID=2637762 RepID=UPI00363F0636
MFGTAGPIPFVTRIPQWPSMRSLTAAALTATVVTAPLALAASVSAQPTESCVKAGQLITDDSNPQIFYECDAALEPDLFECPSDLVFNPVIRDCDDPGNVSSRPR